MQKIRKIEGDIYTRLLLLRPPSFCLSPFALVCLTLSGLARSIRFNSDIRTASSFSSPGFSLDLSFSSSLSLSASLSFNSVDLFRFSMVIRKIVRDRDDLSFMSVLATDLFFSPSKRITSNDSKSVTIFSFELTNTLRCGSSQIVITLSAFPLTSK